MAKDVEGSYYDVLQGTFAIFDSSFWRKPQMLDLPQLRFIPEKPGC